jgi:D-alanine-D-alanine ligase
MNKNLRIEIVRSTKPGLSSLSGSSCEAIAMVLLEKFIDVKVSVINDRKGLNRLITRKPDLVFLGVKYLPKNPKLGVFDTNRLWLADYLSQHNICYTGSPAVAHQLDVEKPMAKLRLLEVGLQTAAFIVARHDEPDDFESIALNYPLFVKPTNRGGGLGVDEFSVALTINDLKRKVSSLLEELGADSLIEEYLNGREFSVAILRQQNSTDYSVMPLELIASKDTSGNRMLGSVIKSSNTEQVSIVSDGELNAKLTELALATFKAIGGKDYGRVDIRLSGTGEPHVLEINLMPSLLKGYGSFPKACRLVLGLKQSDMILQIVNLAFETANYGGDINGSGPTIFSAPVSNLQKSII